jgi:DNA invertase Pin-like site-specific DNA recombinase
MQSTENKPLRLDLLVRVSRRKQEARSPDQQRQLAETSCKAHHPPHQIVKVHDSGRSESGASMDRESLHAVRERIRSGRTDGVIFALTDRVGRAPIEETMTVVRELGTSGYLVLADLGPAPLDLSNPLVETLVVHQLQMARQQLLTIRQRWRQSQSDAIARGAHIGPVPLGYTRPVKGQPLTIDADTAPIVREAFTLREAGHSYSQIRAHMRELGIERSVTGVRKMLSSTVYLGDIQVNGHEPHHGAHEPIVDRATFNRVQRSTAPRGRYEPSARLLARLDVLKCANCGGNMSVSSMTTSAGRPYQFYRCASQRCGHRVTIGADIIERLVVDAVHSATHSTFGSWNRAERNRHAAKRELSAAVANYEAAMAALSDFTDAAAVAKLKELKDTVDDAQARVDRIGGPTRVRLTITTDWSSLSLADQRALIVSLIDEVTVSAGRGTDRVTVTMID